MAEDFIAVHHDSFLKSRQTQLLAALRDQKIRYLGEVKRVYLESKWRVQRLSCSITRSGSFHTSERRYP